MIFVVVTDFNGWQQTRVCLERLRASTLRELQVIVVDHGTTSETADALRAAFPEVLALRASPELWWTGATNVGIREALRRGAQSIVLLNNDCYVTPDTLALLVAHARETDEPTIIAPLQRNLADGKLLANVVTSCFLLGFPTLELPWPRRARPGDHRLHPVALILGGRGVLIPSAVFQRVGLPDEEALPHYGADHDFYLRCARLGIPLRLAFDAFVDIDATRTTRATRAAGMTVRQFAATFSDRRSHRNVRELSTLFRRHYPLRGLHGIGVALNLLRYSLLYFARRIAYAAGRRPD